MRKSVLRRTHALRLALLVAGLSILSLWPLAAGAHTEGVMQVSAEPAGPYMLTVWTSPDPATISQDLHVAIAVVLAEDASPVLEADVLVRLSPEDGGPGVTGLATIENSENKFLHEAILEVPDSGAYLVEILVEGAEGGLGSVAFSLSVEGASGPSLPIIVLAVAVAAGVIFLGQRYLRRPRTTSN